MKSPFVFTHASGDLGNGEPALNVDFLKEDILGTLHRTPSELICLRVEVTIVHPAAEHKTGSILPNYQHIKFPVN